MLESMVQSKSKYLLLKAKVKQSDGRVTIMC